MSEIKNELLKQENQQAAGDDVAQLRKLVESEDRRARTLMRWAIRLWLVFFILSAVWLAIPMIQARTSPPAKTDAAGVPVPLAPATHHPTSVFIAIIGVIVGTGYFAMPIVAFALTVMAISSRRMAGRKQIIASLASIESQLRALTSSRGPSSEG
jgi:magnesium-transporting ATPase (P-type)